MFYKRKTVFDIIKEADGDEASDTAQNNTDGGGDEAPAPEESGDDAAGGKDYGNDDDLDINTSLDDDGGDGGDDAGGDTDMGGDTGGGGDDTSEEEPVESNTDIFSSLSSEEQQLKIMELKRLYSDLYSSIDDTLTKLNDTKSEQFDLDVMMRITEVLYSLRQYINDYIIKVFPNKSYIENDIAFNRFLAILNSVSTIIDETIKIQQKQD